MLPTFIICGAGKSGTTALWAYLKEHPEVCMTRMKEPIFFTRMLGTREGGTIEAPVYTGHYEKGIAWYESLFEHCGCQKVRGEASTAYFYAEDAADLIREILPNVKLIFLLRNPVDRLYSHYWQERKTGWRLPEFTELMNRNASEFQRYYHGSSYKQHLEHFHKRFPQEQILILLYDDLKHKPEHLLRQVYQFIGVRTDILPENLGALYNESTIPRSPKLQRILSLTTRTGLGDKIPKLIRTHVSKLRRRLTKLNQVSIKYFPLEDNIRQELISRLEKDILYVEDLLERPLESWKR